MKKEKFLGYVEMAGLTLVVAATCMWVVPAASLRLAAGVVMAAATVLLALGRFMPKPFYQNVPLHDPRNLTLRRLYHQRAFGVIALAASAVLMLTPSGFYLGLWVGNSSWLLPFVFFVVVEVYTAFRIPKAEKG